jgi:hypothetical protein
MPAEDMYRVAGQSYNANTLEILKPNFTCPFFQESEVYGMKLFSISPEALVKNRLNTCPPVSSSNPAESGLNAAGLLL